MSELCHLTGGALAAVLIFAAGLVPVAMIPPAPAAHIATAAAPVLA